VHKLGQEYHSAGVCGRDGVTCEGESAEFAQLCDSLNVTVRGHQVVAEVQGGERHKGMEAFERRETVVREVQERYMFQYLAGILDELNMVVSYSEPLQRR